MCLISGSRSVPSGRSGRGRSPTSARLIPRRLISRRSSLSHTPLPPREPVPRGDLRDNPASPPTIPQTVSPPAHARPCTPAWPVPVEPSERRYHRLMLDFGAYLRRIGLNPADEPTWQAVHRAHATTIPFENLDSHRGIPVSLEQADLERKL